jgi:transcriptional regulator NrdR family protein
MESVTQVTIHVNDNSVNLTSANSVNDNSVNLTSANSVNDNSVNLTSANSVNDNSIHDNSINLTNEKYIKFVPTDFNGAKFKIFRTVQNNSDSSFFDKSNIDSLVNNIMSLLHKDNFKELKANTITDDDLNSNDSKLIKSKIKNFSKLCNKNTLLKEFSPHISENRSHTDVDSKLRLYPHLLSEFELNNSKESINDYKDHNTNVVNNYLNTILKNALISNNMDINNVDKIGIIEYRNKICVKHNKYQLEEFNLDKIIKITKFKEIVINAIDNLISNHIIDLDKIYLNELKISSEISKHFLEILKNFDK